jgi:hypothetical protein
MRRIMLGLLAVTAACGSASSTASSRIAAPTSTSPPASTGSVERTGRSLGTWTWGATTLEAAIPNVEVTPADTAHSLLIIHWTGGTLRVAADPTALDRLRALASSAKSGLFVNQFHTVSADLAATTRGTPAGFIGFLARAQYRPDTPSGGFLTLRPDVSHPGSVVATKASVDAWLRLLNTPPELTTVGGEVDVPESMVDEFAADPCSVVYGQAGGPRPVDKIFMAWDANGAPVLCADAAKRLRPKP